MLCRTLVLLELAFAVQPLKIRATLKKHWRIQTTVLHQNFIGNPTKVWRCKVQRNLYRLLVSFDPKSCSEFGAWPRIYILFASLVVRIVKNLDLGLSNSSPRSQFFTIRTDPKLVKLIYPGPSSKLWKRFRIETNQSKWKKNSWKKTHVILQGYNLCGWYHP